MLYRALMFLGLVVLAGCAAEKRMGESRIQARRHTKGIHIQHHRDHVTSQNGSGRFEEMHEVKNPDRILSTLTPPTGQNEASWDVAVQKERHGFSAPSLAHEVQMLQEVKHDTKLDEPSVSVVGDGQSTIVRTQSETLPEPIDGRHPNAVPGFILSLGWFLGLVAEGAITYLQIPLSGLAFALGFAASIAGYFLSRRSFRMSREHPELYPRFKLSRAARWVSAAVFAPVALYMALLVILLLVLGGL